ncbi:MAG TPA: PQQ-dependent sugar dehydrogenase, partial [Bacteroidota bacterium]
PGATAAPSAPATSAQSPQKSPPLRVETVASGLEVVWSLAFAPDGRLFFTERPGRIRVMVDGKVLPDPVAELPAASSSESGLMGLALDPAFSSNGYIYIDYTYRTTNDGMANRVSRMTVQGNRAGDEKVLLDGIPASSIHDGGRVKVGPDGKLYVTAGDATNQESAQDVRALSGKVLRLNLDGTVPADNPFPGSPVYSFGHRNPQGLAFQPGTNTLFSTEHGATGNDEVNIIEPGRNYGWPKVQAKAGDPRYVDPISAYTPSIAPAGAVFYDGDRVPEWKGSLFFGTLRGQHLHRIVLGGSDGREVVFEERLFDGEFGRIRDVVVGPDGYLYFATSNRDGRGSPSSDDDLIVRVLPA